MNIAWIGTGVMGKAMLMHLKKGGHHISAYNRTYDKAKELEIEGVRVYKTLKEAILNADLIITMVGYPKDVEEVYMGEDGILNNFKAGAIAVDMTTSSPNLAKQLYEKGKELGLSIVDAPVSGGDAGAKNATLSIMCGGDSDVYEKLIPIFTLMGKSIHYLGNAGSGQHCKAANQICVAGATAAMSEAIFYAQQVGLCPEDMLSAIQGGAAGSWQLTNMAPRVLKHDEQPGFYIKHFIKDMKIIQDVMKEYHQELNMLNSVEHMYECLADNGLENLGTQALIRYYEK